MKLFKVTCNSQFNNINVYALAEDETEASQKAIRKMRSLQYSYDRYVSNVEFIADTDGSRPGILAID